MKTLIEMPNRASSVHRWSGVHLVNPRQNIAEHSFAVTFYCLDLHKALKLESMWSISLGDLLNYALIHDLPEVVTGDLPASIKQRAPEIKQILDTINSLKYNYRMVLTLFYIEGYDSQEISEILKISYSNCRTISSAKDSLRKKLEEL